MTLLLIIIIIGTLALLGSGIIYHNILWNAFVQYSPVAIWYDKIMYYTYGYKCILPRVYIYLLVIAILTVLTSTGIILVWHYPSVGIGYIIGLIFLYWVNLNISKMWNRKL